MISPYTQYNFSSMLLSLLGWLREFIFVSPLPFVLSIVIKDPFFITCKDVPEKQVISLSLKKTSPYRYVIFLILLRVWVTQMPSLLTFFIFFKWQQIVDWDEWIGIFCTQLNGFKYCDETVTIYNQSFAHSLFFLTHW